MLLPSLLVGGGGADVTHLGLSVCLSARVSQKRLPRIRLTRLFYIFIRNIGPNMTSRCAMTRNDHGERESVISDCLVFKCFMQVCQCRYRDYRKYIV